MKELIERWIGSGDIQIVEREVDQMVENQNSPWNAISWISIHI